MRKLLVSMATTATLLIGCTNDWQLPPSNIEPAPKETSLQIPSNFKETAPRRILAHYEESSWTDLPGWGNDSAKSLWLALYENCRGLMRQPSSALHLPARANPIPWIPVCRQVKSIGSNGLNVKQLLRFFETQLRPWKLQGTGLITGYYEPVLYGSLYQEGEYQIPIFSVPKDLLHIDVASLFPELIGKRVRGKLQGNHVVPYDTREDFLKRTDKPPVLLWLNDSVEAFFLQIQGSGKVRLPDGKWVQLAYADHNGQPYYSIGRWLIDHGQLSSNQASMQGIKAWIKAHPHQEQALFNKNPSMVFFKAYYVKGADLGPKGSYGIPIVAGRTIAVDPDYIPLGSPVYLSTTMPNTHQPLQRIVFAQDTGTAIRGAARADFYWGSGEEAGKLAGAMKQPGQMWILWPKSAGLPSAR